MTALEAVFYVAGIVGGFAVVVVPLVLWVGRRIRRANAADTETSVARALAPMVGDVRDLRERMIRAEAQYSNNGGSTLRDRVDRSVSVGGEIKAAFKAFTDRFEDHLEQSREDRERLAHVERILIQRRD